MSLHHQIQGAEYGHNRTDNEQDSIYMHRTNEPRLKHRNEKGGEQQVEERAWKQECPCKVHQLIVPETWQGSANPNEREQENAHLACEPERGHQKRWKEGNSPYSGKDHRAGTEQRERKTVPFAGRARGLVKEDER